MICGVWMRRSVAALVLGIVSASIGVARAEDGSGAGPARAVRLSSVEGQVQVSQGGEVLADHAIANTPLFEGSQIQTGDDGRAEIQFEDGSVARIPPDSSLTLTVLKPGGETEMELDAGMGYFELQDGNQGAMRVRFQSSVVTVSGFTVLRVKLDEGPAELAVFSGNAHMDATNGASLDLRGGESISLGSMTLAESIQQDSWDAWNSDRDQAMTSADVGTPPIGNEQNSGNPAWSDLNSNGTWYNVPDQGYVWSPYDASNPGFDPYGTGYWMPSPYYGYVWVSGYSWGYMPYQCGAWSWYDGFGWGWAPGGCNPWWGGQGWVFNVGYVPTWYRLPVRPHYPVATPMRRFTATANTQPHPIGLRPVAPVISVNRHEPLGVTVLPPREPNRPVQFGSVMAQPVRPSPPVRLGGPVMNNHLVLPGSTKPLNGPPTQGAQPGAPGSTTGTLRPMYPATPAPGTTHQGYAPPPTMGAPRTMPAPVTQRPVYTPPPQAPRTMPAPSSGGGSRPAPSAPKSFVSGGSHVSSGGSHTSSSSSHK